MDFCFSALNNSPSLGPNGCESSPYYFCHLMSQKNFIKCVKHGLLECFKGTTHDWEWGSHTYKNADDWRIIYDSTHITLW